MPFLLLFFTHRYILSVKEKLKIDIRYFINYLTYLDALIYLHDSGQRPIMAYFFTAMVEKLMKLKVLNDFISFIAC